MAAMLHVATFVIVSLQLLCSCLGFLPTEKLELRPHVQSFSLHVEPHCPIHPEPAPLPSPLPDAIQKAFDNLGNYLEKTLNTTSIPGIASNVLYRDQVPFLSQPGIAASVVYRDQVLWSKGFGVKDKTKPEVAPDGSSIFRIGSVSKVFAALMAYQLFDRGMIRSLDDPLSNYCHAFSIRNPYGSSNITLRQMMAQMSGLPREAPCTGNINNSCPQTNEEILGRLKNLSLIYPPWSRPSYSNLAFALIGRCLAEHFNPQLQLTFEEYVRKNILDPLQMKNTGFNITDSVKSKMAVGYNPDGSVAALTDLGWEGPAGQMFSTTDDMNKFAQFFYSVAGENVSEVQATNVLSPDLRRQMMLQVFVNRDQRSGFGTPWEIRFGSNYTILRKGGNVGGYSALFSFIPDLKLGLNVLISGGTDEFEISNSAYPLLISSFVSTLILHQPLYPFPPDPKVYIGEYELDVGTSVTTVTITEYKSQLRLTSQGSSAYLAYRQPLMLQIDYPDYLQPCMLDELLASRHEWVVFESKDTSGVSPSFTIPGLYYGLIFKRKG